MGPLAMNAAQVSEKLLGTAEFALSVKAVAERNGVPAQHYVLGAGFSRRVVELLRDGRIPYQRIRNRLYVDPAQAPVAAELLGLVVSQ